MTPMNIYERLLAAQAGLGNIAPDGTGRAGKGGSREYKYLTLGKLLSAVLPVLQNHGLLLMQHVESSPGEGCVFVKTQIIDPVSEAIIESSAGIGCDIADSQRVGSAITYLRRYAVTSMLGISVDADDDGAATVGGGDPRRTFPSAAPQPRPVRERSDRPLLDPSAFNLLAPLVETPAHIVETPDPVPQQEMTAKQALEQEITLIANGDAQQIKAITQRITRFKPQDGGNPFLGYWEPANISDKMVKRAGQRLGQLIRNEISLDDPF